MEEQTSANAEELEAPSTESPATGETEGTEATPETGKKSGRTLKLKGAEAEASDAAPSDPPAGAPAEASADSDKASDGEAP